MKAYGVFELTVTDPAWVPDYLAQVSRLVKEHGGRWLAKISPTSPTDLSLP